MADNNLDFLVDTFVKTRASEDMAKLLEVIEKSNVYVPAVPPKDLSPDEISVLQKGGSVRYNSKAQPDICLLKGSDGKLAIPVFTSREQIPEERKKQTPAILHMPFITVVKSVMNNPDKVANIVIDPFTYGVVLNKKLVELMNEKYAAMNGEGPRTVQVTEKQFHTIVHTKVARTELPRKFLNDTADAISDLRLKKEQMIIEEYKKAYGDQAQCPYTEDDIAVMMMQIEENLLIIRIDMPEENMVPAGPARIYIACEGEDEARFFIIEKAGKDVPANIAEVTGDGEYSTLALAPDNGAEIETIISFVKPS